MNRLLRTFPVTVILLIMNSNVTPVPDIILEASHIFKNLHLFYVSSVTCLPKCLCT